MSLSEVTSRVCGHLGAVARLYPHAWEQMASFREAKGSAALGDWPNWCWVPLAGAMAVITKGRDELAVECAGDVGRVGALAAWRQTQGIYQIDDTLLGALWNTTLDGEIPVDVLYRLPEWCVYVPTPGRAIGPLVLAGFFAHLEHDMNDGRTELRLLLDVNADGTATLIPIPLHVWVAGGLAAAAGRARAEAEFQARAHGVTGADAAVLEQAALDCAPLVSLVLYLCSTAAEMRDAKGGDRTPRRPRAETTRAANAPTVWETGFRLGPALRVALECAQAPVGDGTHASPRPHIRRAHWHGFWSGPRDATKRVLDLLWLPPIPVGVDEGAPIVPTVRRV